MNDLEARGFGCRGCSGTCCTFEANSMMVSPLEALDLMAYLREQELLSVELKEKIQLAIKTHRLDHHYGGRTTVRKTYTCPFFNHQELGCPLPREIKPYGCLAFNAHHESLKAGEHCHSDLGIQETRAQEFHEEEKRNSELRALLGLTWQKSPLPTALLDLWDKDLSAADPAPR